MLLVCNVLYPSLNVQNDFQWLPLRTDRVPEGPSCFPVRRNMKSDMISTHVSVVPSGPRAS